MPVTFNQIPANLRVPLFYAEVNAGQSPYQGPSRLLLIGQRTSAGSMAANTIQILSGDAQALAGPGSQLAEMAILARQNDPFGEIWLGALADPSGAAAVQQITVASGILGGEGTVVVYISGQRIEVGVASTDANTDVAANIVAAINAGYVAFGRPLTFPVIAAVNGSNANKVDLTARNVGALGNKIAVDFNLVGDEGPLQQYLSVASTTAGTGTPALGTLLAALGDIEFDWIAAPYADTTSLDVIKTFLDGVSGRWSPLQQIFGLYITALFDSYSNLAAAGTARNDPNASIMGVANSPSPPWHWAAALGGAIHADKNLGGDVDQAYRISQPLQTIELVGIKPPKNRVDWFSITQRNTLYQDGISGFRVQNDGTVLIDRVITTYQLNSYNQPDITWLSIETRAQMVYYVRYNRQRITQVYGRMALADDGAEGRPGIVTPKMLKAECVHIYKELEAGGLVENSALFAESLVVERSSDPNRVNAYLPVDVVNQFNVFAANVTTFLQYPAA
jgi:phage tail sheath gpL-like